MKNTKIESIMDRLKELYQLALNKLEYCHLSIKRSVDVLSEVKKSSIESFEHKTTEKIFCEDLWKSDVTALGGKFQKNCDVSFILEAHFTGKKKNILLMGIIFHSNSWKIGFGAEFFGGLWTTPCVEL